MPDCRAEAATEAPTEIDTSVAHEARVYDYWLSGKDNYPAERAARRCDSHPYSGDPQYGAPIGLPRWAWAARTDIDRRLGRRRSATPLMR
ncbi:SAM-dependent methyltransferase [Nocardia sp. CA-084685]|uniref:SAM-dependent methyltransferase n=1 Tax=Nocardia sp. CA-084685 TaxID=3239970 RepID=UPI003D95C38A